jgi:hypothetical protein
MSRGVMLFDHDFADIRLITIIAAARHPCPAHATHLIMPSAVGMVSQTHPMPRQMWQCLFILPLVTSAYLSQLLANRRCRIANLIDEPL